MYQTPATGTQLLKWVGDILEVHAFRDQGPAGRMVFRTNLGQARTRLAEVLAHMDEGQPFIQGNDWHDIPMELCGKGEYRVKIALLEVGVFAGKACFLPDATPIPEWPDGGDLMLKVAPAHTSAGNMIYAAFIRQFGAFKAVTERPKNNVAVAVELDKAGYTVIPPSGTFRDFIKELDHICVRLGFRNILLLPIHPTPTTFARMGRYGSPFAGRDFLDIDPALAEFDTTATPLDQFKELVGAVHARGACLMLDLPANHTGWAATFMTHHPEWYKRNPDGSFHSPGAWGVTWADLVELDYSKPALRRAIAEVFLYWCRNGVDGFRCDAGYMIPKGAWDVIVALVRREFPDTVFLLEGLGGAMETTEALIGETGLDWAYSEMFQTLDRGAFEWMMPKMLTLSQTRGPLIHFAETHDNNRLAATSQTYARLRTMLSALFSQQGGFGITAGVEWYAQEKIDVHGCGGLNWGAKENQCALIHRLNTLQRCHPLFGTDTTLELIQQGEGNVLAAVRRREGFKPLLILANLDAVNAQTVHYKGSAFPGRETYDLISGEACTISGTGTLLAPGQVRCLSTLVTDLRQLNGALCQRGVLPVNNRTIRARRTMALNTLTWLGDPINLDQDLGKLVARFILDPLAFTAQPVTGLPRVVRLSLPQDLRREIMVPSGHLLYVIATGEFRAVLSDAQDVVLFNGRSVAFADATYGLLMPVRPSSSRTERLSLRVEQYGHENVTVSQATILALGQGVAAGLVRRRFSGLDVKALQTARALLTNGTGAMAQIRLKWGDIRSQYDCLLALNRHPAVPDDRQIFLTRCRAWILVNGYSTPINSLCLEHVTVQPDGSAAEWQFAVPCGMGRRVPILLRIALEPLTNRVALRWKRGTAPATWRDPADSVGLVLRPEIEWRNFHHKTKAYAGPEKEWPKALVDEPNGFKFSPEPNVTLGVHLNGGDWNRKELWSYCVQHPEEEARGQEKESDLWSPGWFHIELAREEEALLIAGETLPTSPAIPALAAELPFAPLPLRDAMQQALGNYIVRRDQHRTVIAGYPWFLDWGRDTLIFLRGVVAAKEWETVLDVLTEFGRFEKGGTLPNMIRGEDDANRETVDAPLWFGAIVADVINALGAKKVLPHLCGERSIETILLSIARGYIKGTDNGIRVDMETGLVWAPAHYTWMDTNYPAGTPRNGYPVEVQALWVKLLDLLGEHVNPKWNEMAALARASFCELFPLPDHGGLADCLYAEAGVGARKAEADDAVRPNQLYAITLGLLNKDKPLCADVLRACEQLLTPGSMRSLADRPVARALEIRRDRKLLNRPHHPYFGHYLGDEDTQRKPAYHNGTGWTFTFPLYAEALWLTYGEAARETARAYLNSATELINQDTVTQLPECTQGDAPHAPCGTGAQAWGVSELFRVVELIG
ncbi:MAG: amylo-alpha-1,6-glucosidase [Kiritimatiellia bacterium]